MKHMQTHPYLREQFGHIIDGKTCPSVSDKSIETFNPATGQVLCKLAAGKAKDVDAAVRAARCAFESEWSEWTPAARHGLLPNTETAVRTLLGCMW